jgi:SAM-dependent methyltransferase
MRKHALAQMGFLRPFLSSDATMMEIGAGTCALSLEASKLVRQVYAIEISEDMVDGIDPPSNFRLVVSDGIIIPVAKESIDIAYSHQVIEHLHPDDALDQAREIHARLKRGGIYVCITPNRLSGPHDVSKHFDRVACGSHLKEYTITELSRLLQTAGFAEISVYAGTRGAYLQVPSSVMAVCERLLERLPYPARTHVARALPTRALLGIYLVARK